MNGPKRKATRGSLRLTVLPLVTLLIACSADALLDGGAPRDMARRVADEDLAVETEDLGRCGNGVKDGDESDVDCGGSCGGCDDGKACRQGGDCVSGLCTGNVCAAPLVCGRGTADCDGNAANGCETSTQADALHCGDCARVCPNNAPICADGRCEARIKVLLVAAADARGLLDVQQKLTMTGSFSMVDTFDAGMATPSVMQLSGYAAVLTWAEGNGYKDAGLLGDNLATYFDGGGRVVVAMFALYDAPGLALRGRFGTLANGYLLLEPGRLLDAADALGAIAEPKSALVAGVKSLAATSAFATGGAVRNSGVVVASWASRAPLIVRGRVHGRNRVDLNLFPVSNAIDARFWSGDGAVMMRNALVY